MSPTLKGVLLSLVGTALFTPVYAAGKLAEAAAGIAVPVLLLVALRYVGGWFTVVAAILLTRTPVASLRSPAPWRHVIRASLGAGGGFFTIYAATEMPVARATAIGLTEGLMVVALAALVLGERVTRGHWLAGGLCAFGALVVVLQVGAAPLGGPAAALPASGGSRIDGGIGIGVIAAFAGAVCIAVETLYIKVLARSETALGVLLHVNTFAGAAMIALAFFGGALTREALAVAWPAIVIGPLAIAGQFFNILAYREADAAVLGPVNYAWIVFAALLGWAAFGEVPTLATVLGSLLIVAGGIALSRLPSGATIRTGPGSVSGTAEGGDEVDFDVTPPAPARVPSRPSVAPDVGERPD